MVPSEEEGGSQVRTVLVCVRTPVAAQAIAVCANRLGMATAVRTAAATPSRFAHTAIACAASGVRTPTRTVRT